MPSNSIIVNGSTTAASAISWALSSRRKFFKRCILQHASGKYLPGTIKNNRNCHGYAKRNFQGLGIVEGNLCAWQMKCRECSQHVRDISQSLHDALFPNYQDHCHNTRNQCGEYQHRDQVMWSRKSADCTGEFPIPTAQASYQNQRQQKSEAQAGSEQGIFSSTQSPGQGIRPDTHAEARYGQPIGDTSRPPVRPTRDRGKQGSQDPHSIFHHACGKYRSVVIIKT